MMWVDGVGGYLTCLSDAVRLGQAIPGTSVEIPLVGDLSRHHATIIRQGEGYFIEPHAATRVGSRGIATRHNLSDGDEIQLGSSLWMRFRQPHPLSSTARLELLSHHRTHPSADAILLMAGTCLMGPMLSNHVVCRGWSHEVVLVRQGQSLTCHVPRPFSVDGEPFERRAAVTLDSNIQGEDFCVSFERIV
jgi:hypothetical protein